MPAAFDFNKIVYRRPSDYVGARYISDLIGFDTEALKSGEPFIFCLSDGTAMGPGEFPHRLFTRQYRNRHFGVWNLRYDAGATLRAFTRRQLQALQTLQEVTVGGFNYRYFPHKFYRVSKGKNAITFWDIAGFYQMSLDAAAKRYLGESKIELETKTFSKAYVREHRARLIEYCVKDARLTRDLGLYLLRYLDSFGVRPSSLYSQASVAFLYFKKEAGIVDVWDYWRNKTRLLYFACNAYAGGKFEMTARGRFEGSIYDISSAYPSELAKLPDLRGAKVVHSKDYQAGADLGFLHVGLSIERPLFHSVPFKLGGVNTFPVGRWKAYITKREYDYLAARGVRPKIIEAFWLKCRGGEFPYEACVRNLWKIKEDVGESDVMKYDLVKKLLNGFYGKTCQLTELPDGTLRAGAGWNPIYAAEITANVRLRMAEAQEYLGEACYAVHTDSVLTTKPLPSEWVSQGLGGWKLKKSGEGVVLACGVYEHASRSANRGFEMKPGFSWREQLRAAGEAFKLKLTEHRPLSWTGGASRDMIERINEFMDFPKELDLNGDRKRVWPLALTAKRLLAESQQSVHRPVFRS